MEKLGCILEMMFGNILFGEQVGGHIVQAEQLLELKKLGFHSYLAGQDEQAIKYFKQAIKVCPRADIYNDLGLVYLRDGDYVKAINSFKSALNIDSSFLPAFYNLGVALHYSKIYDIAENIFSEVIATGKELEKDVLLSAYSDKACAQKRKGDVQGAIKTFKEALALDDKYVPPYSNLGNIYIEQGKMDEAKASLEKALSIDPRCAQALNGLGVIELENGNFDAAQEFFTKAMAVDQSCKAAIFNMELLKRNKEKLTKE